MNKKGEFSIVQVVAPLLILIFIVIILAWAGPAYGQIREMLGFQVGLTIEEQDVQEESMDIIDDVLIHGLYSCKNSLKEGCFCLIENFSLPTDYKIEFKDEANDMKLTFFNNRNGKFLEKWIGDTNSCVDDNGVFIELDGNVKNDKISLSFSSIVDLFFNFNGKDIRKEVNGDFMFYKPKQGVICVVSNEMSALRDKNNICD